MITVSIAVSAIYTLFATMAYVVGWRMAAKSQRAMTLYGLIAIALRMLSAALVVLGFIIMVRNTTARHTFVVIFSIFYLLMLIFDVIFYIYSQKQITN